LLAFLRDPAHLACAPEKPGESPSHHHAENAMPASYQVTIAMSQPTIDALQRNGFNLYAFRPVQAAPGGGAPVAWFQTGHFFPNTVITWIEDYEVYTSQTQTVPGVTVIPSFSAPVGMGQTLAVNTPDLTGQVSAGGAPGAMSIVNQTSATFTCGMAAADPNGNISPVCALTAFPNVMCMIRPVPQILLMMATANLSPGTVVDQVGAVGILLSLASSPTQTVSYDYIAGWNCNGGNCTAVQPNQSLVPILIRGL
jgi:hypothetical protein